MKNPKKLTYAQKQLLEKTGHDPAEYYCVKHVLGQYWFIKKKDMEKLRDRKDRKVNFLILND